MQGRKKMINVYVNGNTITALAELELGLLLEDKQDIAVEFIDAAPLTAEVTYNEEGAEISIYVRDEMHTNSNIVLHGIAKNGEVVVDEGDEDTVKIAFAVAEGVNSFLYKNDMMEECLKLDFDMQGVLFETDDNEEIKAKIVEGKKRPALLCTTLFGAPRMVRPYSNEIMNQFALESMSFEDMEKNANAGEPSAMEYLAMLYLNGDDEIDVNPEKSYYWFVKLAETGDDQALFNVGLFTAKGFGTERDFVKAAEWMQKAAEKGDEDAEVCAAEYRKLADAIEKAKAGDAQSQADIACGLMKLGGALEQAGDSKDYEESVMWAEKAVAQGNLDGYWTLALAYHHGRGVDEDMDKAITLYQKGAELGSAACQHNLGCEYMSGMNVKKDTHKAFELIKMAAEQGYGLAMRDLGKCYQFANGTPGNMKKAVEWYEKALEIIDDSELAQKTEMFKMMADMDPSFDEDYPEDDSDGVTESEDVTDVIREGLRASGKKYDDDTIEDLSLEEAYEALVVGMESSEEKEKKISSENEEVRDFFEGKNFVLSGFDTFTETSMKEIIEENGGIVRSSTVMDTDYLIYHDRFGVGTKKHKRALELNDTKGKNIKIISQQEFYGITNRFDLMKKGEDDMAKGINEITGKEITVPDEEIVEALHSGKGTIKQIVTLPNGTKKEVAVWGGYELDGFDRTLNVFMNQEDINTFAKIITEDKIDPDSLVDPCEDEKGIQVTVDFMDIAATLIYRKGQGKLSTELYVRDERKTFQDVVEIGTGEIELNEEGGISLDAEILQNNKFLIYAIAVLGVRRYLLKEGIVKKLYDMFDESAGVVIKVSKSGNISARIVKGMERPDLPCDVFLMGEQICRPYIDEILGLKSTGVRKIRKSQYVEKKNVENSGTKDKKAVEKVRKSEEAKNVNEERKAKIEDAETKRKQEMAEWENKVKKIEDARKKEEQERTEQIKKETMEEKEKLLREKEEVIAKCENDITRLKNQVKEDKQELEGLGVFKLARKKELKLAIERNTSYLKEKEENRLDIPKQFQMDMDATEVREKAKLKSLIEELDKKYLIPENPDERRKREEEERKEKEKKAMFFKGEKGQDRRSVLETLWYSGKALNVREIRALGGMEYYPQSKLTTILNELSTEGYVDRVVLKGITYYCAKELD